MNQLNGNIEYDALSNEVLTKFNSLNEKIKQCDDIINENMAGGSKANSEKYKKKLKKYKKMVKDLAYTVEYFKQLANYYFNASLFNNQYYSSLKTRLQNMHDKMSNMNNNVNVWGLKLILILETLNNS